MTNTNDNAHDLTLLIGAGGKTGRRVAERLRARGRPVRAGSPSTQPPFDWQDRATWGPALEGAASAYVSFFPDLAIPGAPEAVAAFADEAIAAGTRRLVLISGRNEDEAQRAERALQTSGADWTIVRCAFFNQNLSEGYLLESVLAGEVALPAGDEREPFVDADDIADAALTEDGHVGRLYELTGPRLLTFPEAVAEVARASGLPVRYEQISVDAFAEALERDGLPDELIALLTYVFGDVLGRGTELADGVQRALGREPRDFADFARRAAAAGAWSAARDAVR
jgi:uncharacterized protein YbjT (DUF2867 family)